MIQTVCDNFRARYLDVLGSIYIYNEHRGYTSLDRVLTAARLHCPQDSIFITAVSKHRADERKHYLMFKRWFQLQGRMPLAVGSAYGHIDRFIDLVFGCGIDELDTDLIVANPMLFEKLCRVVVLTERRGLVQVEELLQSPLVRSDSVMHRIFRIVHADEPSHFLPYQDWLDRQSKANSRWSERVADWCIHKVLLFVKLPSLFLDGGAKRLSEWPDAEEIAQQ